MIKIGATEIELDKPPYFVADIAANHDGDINRAFKLIELAKEAGANAAKFQNFRAETIISENAFKSAAQVGHQAKWKKSVFETYQDASLPFDWTQRLKEKCEEVNIEYFTSPYDFEAVDFVDKYVNCYKIGSGDITWIDFIEYIAKKNKPVMLATGASSFEDVKRAVEKIIAINPELILMQCNTNYTANLENFEYINLNVLTKYKENWNGLILGLSDHTKGHSTVLGAITLGARVIEKHFTDNENREGPDHKFSMTPIEWEKMVRAANELFLSLGDGIKRVEKNENDTVKIQRRSIYLVSDKKQGDVLSPEDFIMLRPYNTDGFAPFELNDIIGKKCLVNLSCKSLLKRSDIYV